MFIKNGTLKEKMSKGNLRRIPFYYRYKRGLNYFGYLGGWVDRGSFVLLFWHFC